jgi:hypothetical protein
MRFGPPFDYALRQDGRRVAYQVVGDRVAGSGFSFADRGSHSLKGIPDDWQLYAVELAAG